MPCSKIHVIYAVDDIEVHWLSCLVSAWYYSELRSVVMCYSRVRSLLTIVQQVVWTLQNMIDLTLLGKRLRSSWFDLHFTTQEARLAPHGFLELGFSQFLKLKKSESSEVQQNLVLFDFIAKKIEIIGQRAQRPPTVVPSARIKPWFYSNKLGFFCFKAKNPTHRLEKKLCFFHP